MAVVDRRAVDLKPLVDAKEMRRGEQAGPQAVSARDVGAEGSGRALAVGAAHRHRIAREPGAVDHEAIKQLRHSRQTNPIAKFGKVKHSRAPWPKRRDARISGSG